MCRRARATTRTGYDYVHTRPAYAEIHPDEVQVYLEDPTDGTWGERTTTEGGYLADQSWSLSLSSSISSRRTSAPTVSWSVTVCLTRRIRSTGTVSVRTTGRSA